MGANTTQKLITEANYIIVGSRAHIIWGALNVVETDVDLFYICAYLGVYGLYATSSAFEDSYDYGIYAYTHECVFV